MKLTVDSIVEDVISHMKKSKEKFILVEDFPQVLTEIINKKYGKFTYTSEVGMAIKNRLKNSSSIELYKSDYSIYDNDGACTVTLGEYFVLKGAYRNVVDMKEQHRIIPMIFKRRQDVIAWENGEIDID